MFKIKQSCILLIKFIRITGRQRRTWWKQLLPKVKIPLTSLKGYTQLLNSKARKPADEFAINSLNKVETQVNKMNILINGFLNVTRLESGKIIMNKKYINLKELT